MKPYQFGLTTLASTAALAVAGTAVIPTLAENRAETRSALAGESGSGVALHAGVGAAWIAALPSGDRLWVKVRQTISLEELATKLAQDESKLARLNDVDEDHRFSSGDRYSRALSAKKQRRYMSRTGNSNRDRRWW